jgi:DnaJ-class molecular chaperone
MPPEEPLIAPGCCCTCNGSGLDGDSDTCRDCHGTGIDNHGA